MAALILWGGGKSFGKCRTQLWSRGEQICSKSYGISTIFKKSSCWRCFFVTRRGSFWSVVSELRFGLIGAFSQGKTSSWLVPWGFGVASKKPRLSWAKSAALKADGLKKNWEMLGVDLVAAGDATEMKNMRQKPSKSTQIDDVFVFEERLTMRNASLFKSTKKNKTLPSFGRNLLRLKEAATTETIYFFPIEHAD